MVWKLFNRCGLLKRLDSEPDQGSERSSDRVAGSMPASLNSDDTTTTTTTTTNNNTNNDNDDNGSNDNTTHNMAVIIVRTSLWNRRGPGDPPCRRSPAARGSRRKHYSTSLPHSVCFHLHIRSLQRQRMRSPSAYRPQVEAPSGPQLRCLLPGAAAPAVEAALHE